MGDNSNIFSQSELANKSADLERSIATEEAQIEADKNRIFMEKEKMEDELLMMDFDFFGDMGIDEEKFKKMYNQSLDTINNLNQDIAILQEKETNDKAELAALRNYEWAAYLQRVAPTNYVEKKYRWYIADKSGCGTPEDDSFACPQLINYINKNFKEQGDKIKQINEKRHVELIADTLNSIENLIGVVDVFERLEELYKLRKMEYEQLKNAIDEQKFTTWTSERKVIYEDKAINYIDFIKFNITIFYYILFVVYLFIGDFFVKQRYKNYKSWLLMLAYLGIPFIMKKFVILLFFIGYQISYFTSSRMPKDVYLNI